MKHRLFLSCLVILISACKPASNAPDAAAPAGNNEASSAKSGKPQVLVANYPLQYFAQRIAGDVVEVRFLAPKDEDPAFWQPNEAAIAAFQNADLILMNGATYSKWADKITLPESKVVDTSSAFANNFIQITDATTHSHGPGGEHSHSGTAFTTWIDFKQAALQAQAVCTALIKLVPAAKDTMEKNTEALKDELEALDERLSTLSRRLVQHPLVASHPVYHYLVRRYGLNLKSVLWEPDTVLDDKYMSDLNAILATHRARWMIWEGEPSKDNVQKLAALGLQSVVFDPCGNVPDSGDFMTVMKANVEVLEKAFP
ncbi:metal ABC transporter substrate-binding protein [Prosthecobacter sp.]|uniref:metal ABC transporter substrate-binding protein n=1 Tax=Prosthecobacter sp. TaxID=1965333 RepID=UPI002ABCDD1D|nr:metal ABC transporter substrate-binding protein [Prosthecobacter sp.]MDZ4404160.1 metal ABC transporter substrate-binding protein [Prosthecobacter sp.]